MAGVVVRDPLFHLTEVHIQFSFVRKPPKIVRKVKNMIRNQPRVLIADDIRVIFLQRQSAAWGGYNYVKPLPDIISEFGNVPRGVINYSVSMASGYLCDAAAAQAVKDANVYAVAPEYLDCGEPTEPRSCSF